MTHRLAITAFLVTLAWGAAADDARLAATLRQGAVRTEGERVVVWAPSEQKQLAARLDGVVVKVETLLGLAFDAKAYGQAKIEYFLSDSDDVPSHVYGAYDHSAAAGHPPYIFLSGLDSGEAPDIHETAHLIGGKFGSLLLREGMATYVQFAVRSGKMRPLVKMGDVTDIPSLDEALRRQFAKPVVREQAVQWILEPAKKVKFTSRPDRGLFYAVSASWVAFLVEHAGMEAVMEAYAADDPIAALQRRGVSWTKLANQWDQRGGT